MIDIWILFASYFISVISLGIALYCIVTVNEFRDTLKRNKPKVYDVKSNKQTKINNKYNWK